MSPGEGDKRGASERIFVQNSTESMAQKEWRGRISPVYALDFAAL